jgi:hypothetical protein
LSTYPQRRRHQSLLFSSFPGRAHFLSAAVKRAREVLEGFKREIK